MEEREENELCHLLMGDLRDERQKAGKQIASQKALVLFPPIFLSAPTQMSVGTFSVGAKQKCVSYDSSV